MPNDKKFRIRRRRSLFKGMRGELVIPNEMVECSISGRREAIDFWSRLAIARKTLKLFPEFRAAFAKHFHPKVVEVASTLVLCASVDALVQRLASCDAEIIERLKSSCKKYPYLRIVNETADKLVIAVVEEAISFEAMASQLKAIIGTGLEQVFSPEEAADWGMSHILAWAMDDLACQDRSRSELSKLAPAQGGKLIWEHTWCGEEFCNRFALAARYLAAEIAGFVLDALKLKIRSLTELEILLGLRSSDYYLTIASDAAQGEHPVLEWATTKYVGLRKSDALAVADALCHASWRDITDERARRSFVLTEAKRKSLEFDYIVLSSLGGVPGISTCGGPDWNGCGLQALAAGRDSILAAFVPEFSTIPIGADCSEAMEAFLSFKGAMTDGHLSLDVQRVVYAKLQDYTRNEAHIPLGISKKRVEAAWRELNRKKNSIRNALLK